MVVVVNGSRYHHFLFAPLITFPDRPQFRVSLDRGFPRASTTSTSKPGYEGRKRRPFQVSTVMSFSAAR